TGKDTNQTNVMTKGIFARHGIPKEIMSDNGSQFSSKEYKTFTRQWEINHKTTSPEYPQSKGLVEREIQTIKKMWKKIDNAKADKHLAILAYRNTLKGNEGHSPTQMSRQVRDLLILEEMKLRPQVPHNRNEVKPQNEPGKEKTFTRGERIWFRKKNPKTESWTKGKIWKKDKNPRSYWTSWEICQRRFCEQQPCKFYGEPSSTDFSTDSLSVHWGNEQLCRNSLSTTWWIYSTTTVNCHPNKKIHPGSRVSHSSHKSVSFPVKVACR
uniref:Integrase catalytic domain-containing protein n=1 Tax=Callorhinchus milii TaxID=7868 RepID=A0A4W3IMK3_CALMI